MLIGPAGVLLRGEAAAATCGFGSRRSLMRLAIGVVIVVLVVLIVVVAAAVAVFASHMSLLRQCPEPFLV